MGKKPSFPFYPNDWSHDLKEHPLEIEGAWIRIICALWWEQPIRGKASKTQEEWARILGVSIVDSSRILNYIGRKKIGEVTSRVTLGDKFVTVKCRRMYKYGKASELHRLRQRKYRARRKGDGKRDAPSFIPSSFPSNKSDKSVTKKPVLIEGRDGQPIALKDILEEEE